MKGEAGSVKGFGNIIVDLYSYILAAVGAFDKGDISDKFPEIEDLHAAGGALDLVEIAYGYHIGTF